MSTIHTAFTADAPRRGRVDVGPDFVSRNAAQLFDQKDMMNRDDPPLRDRLSRHTSRVAKHREKSARTKRRNHLGRKHASKATFLDERDKKTRNDPGVKPSHNLSTIGGRIKAAREAANINQSQLADRIGVSRAAVHQWENDQWTPSLRRFEALARELAVPLLWLLRREGPAPLERDRDSFALLDIGIGVDRSIPETRNVAGSPQIVRQYFGSESERLRLLHVASDEMAPSIPIHSYVCVDIGVTKPQDGQIHVIDNGTSLILRRLHLVHGRPKNKPQIEIARSKRGQKPTRVPAARLKIVGLVTGVLTKV